MILFVPVILPTVQLLGIHEIHLGIVLVKLRLKPSRYLNCYKKPKSEMKNLSPQRRRGRRDDLSFSLPLTPQDRLRYLRGGGRRQKKMNMPFRQDLTDWNNQCKASEFSLFCPLSRKGKVTSSAISAPLVPLPAGRAVRYRSNPIAKLGINVKILSHEDI